MSRRCEATGKGIQVGHRVSHSNIKTNHRFLPNLQKKRFWSTELNRFVTLRVAASTIRSVDKLGIDAYAKKHGVKLA